MTHSKNPYAQNKFGGMTPEQLVLAMYDGALRFLKAAAEAAEPPMDVGRKGTAVSKALAIVAELQAALNPEAGEFTDNMLGLYDYVMRTVSEANVKNDPKGFREAATLLQTVRDGWAEMIDRKTAATAAQAASTPAPAQKQYV